MLNFKYPVKKNYYLQILLPGNNESVNAEIKLKELQGFNATISLLSLK